MNKLFKIKLNIPPQQTSLIFTLLIIFIFSIWQVSASPIEISHSELEQIVEGGGNDYFFPLVAHLGTFDSPPPAPVSLPEIVSFTSSVDTILVGESADLNWEISGSTSAVSIDNEIGDVLSVTTYAVSPTVTTTYVLTAENGAGSVSAELTITVNEPEPEPEEPPTIISFTASKTSIQVGQSTTLSWEVTNFDTLRLNKGIGVVTSQTSMDVSPTEDTTYRLTATNGTGETIEKVTISVTSGGGGGGGGSTGGPQIVIFDWNKKVTQSDRGFPWNQPPMENGNWKSPYNYAGGTLYVRAQIKNQPVPQQDMRLQFCFWQELNGNKFGLETCITTKNVPGTSGTVRCWSSPLQSMWKLNNAPLDWDRPRYRVAAVVKNGAKDPVSDYNGWNWNGENPAHWYPLDMRFTVIVVPKGSSFAGWGSYGGC